MSEYLVRSESVPGLYWRMVVTPEGVAVHQGEGCLGERFHGVAECAHSKEIPMTQAVTPYTGSTAIEKVEFTSEQIQVLKNTICRGASDAELQLFTYACQDTGLDPFLKQIWAIMRKVKVDDHYEQQLTIQIGIDGYRVMRDRIKDKDGVPLFDGMDGPVWSDDGETWFDFPAARPNYAKVAVYRRGISRPFVAVARLDAYEQDSPLWKKMAAEQLAKCAEALAYRRAFPAEMAKLPSGAVADYDPPELVDAPAPSPQVASPKAEPSDVIEGEVIEAVTDEQLATITEWTETLNEKRKAAGVVAAGNWVKNEFPHVVVNDRLQLRNLTSSQASEYIKALQVFVDTGKAPEKQEAFL